MPSQRSSSQGAGATWARPRLKDTPAFCLPRASGSQPVKAARPRPGLTSSTGCPSSNKAQPQLLMVERKRLSFVSHTGGQDLRGDPIWQMWKQVQHGSNFPKATLLLCPPSLQTLPWAALPLDPSLTSSWHGCQGQRLWTTKDLRNGHIQVLPEWMGKRPREGKELPKVTRQNETWAKGTCVSTLLISREPHQSEWPFTKVAPAPTGP